MSFGSGQCITLQHESVGSGRSSHALFTSSGKTSHRGCKYSREHKWFRAHSKELSHLSEFFENFMKKSQEENT